MESAALFRSFHTEAKQPLHLGGCNVCVHLTLPRSHQGGIPLDSICTTSHLKSVSEMPGIFPMNNVVFSDLPKLPIKGFVHGAKLASSSNKSSRLILSCAKTSETTVTVKSEDSQQNGQVQRSPQPTDTFPKGFEALITEVCDDTEIAELKLKVGGFEMHLKRKIESPIVHAPVVSPPPSPPPSASKPAVSASPVKPSSEKISPFTNIDIEKSKKIEALEAAGASGYVLVSSPTVGSFRRARTLKGKKQPPACKEGDVVKVGQTIGFLDQFGSELAVKSDAAGEVLKLLCNDGDAVGYGDPLLAVLP